MSLWEDDPRTDEELLAAYCVRAEEAGEDWWAFPQSLARGEKHGVPRRAADQAEWDIVTDCETASVIDEQIRADEEAGRLSVRSHPWLKVGTVVAFRKDELGAFKIGPY